MQYLIKLGYIEGNRTLKIIGEMEIQPSSDLKKRGITESVTAEAAKKLRELKKEGKPVIDFTQGRPEPPDFDLPDGFKRGMIEAIRRNKTVYTNVAGVEELREALAKEFSEELGVKYNSSEVIVGPGGRALIKSALEVVVDIGDGQDEVLYATPAWPTYVKLIKGVGGRPVAIGLKPPYKLKCEDILNRLQDVRLAAILLNSPNNPSGAIIDTEEFEKISRAIEIRNKDKNFHRKPVVLIFDCLYKDITFNRNAKTIVSVNKNFKEQSIIIDGASKAYNATGLRICYAAGPKSLIKAMAAVQSNDDANANSAAQYGLLAALTKYRKETDRELEMFWRRHKKRRDFAYKELSKVRGLEALRPEGTFYIWVKVPVGANNIYKTDKQWVEALLEKKYVGVMPGEEFGGSGYARLSLATAMKDVREGIKRIREFVEETEQEENKLKQNIQP